MIVEKASFKAVPAMYPMKTPQLARKAAFPSLPAKSSPKKAPTMPPTRIPQGGKNKRPRGIPRNEPHMPAFDAPYFFAPPAGIKYSKTVNSTVTRPIIMRKNPLKGSH